MRSAEIKIGVLGFHGSVEEHVNALKKCGVEVVLVKNPEDLARVKGLIIPGGESTHMSLMLEKNGLYKLLQDKIKKGFPVYGTCAGAILLAKKVIGDKKVKSFNAIDIEISRNAYGRQLDSFEADVKIPALGKKPFNAVFIRAPKIVKVSRKVEVLAEYAGEIILARQGQILVSTFHPEMSQDLRVHQYFLSFVQ